MKELDIEELAKKAIDEINDELGKQGLANLPKSDEPFVIDIQESYEEKDKKLASLEEALNAVDEVLSKTAIKPNPPKIEEPMVESPKELPDITVSVSIPGEEISVSSQPAKPAAQEIPVETTPIKTAPAQVLPQAVPAKPEEKSQTPIIIKEELIIKQGTHSEAVFLENIRERILVLFEGLSTSKDELKFELTINFLEFLLAKIEERLKK